MVRYLGLGWVFWRLLYALKLRSGWFKWRTPARLWSAFPLEDLLELSFTEAKSDLLEYRRKLGPRFFFSSADRLRFESFFQEHFNRGSIEEADEICEGRFRHFSREAADRGFPPDWHEQPVTKQRFPADRHWSQIADFSNGDIKWTWELGRFSFVFPLVRAYWRTGDERYPEAFWRLFESFRDENPPNLGPHYKCGQEVSLRLMACCFGLYGFLDSPATTARRVELLTRSAAVSAQRIAGNIGYALSQKNNHSVSEAAGLWTCGLVFPELRGAAKWREHGRRLLESLAAKQIYDDGCFCMHSFNYQRFILHVFNWTIRLGDLNEQPLSDELKRRVKKSAELFYQLQDDKSGWLPNCGSDDGALVLPLTDCDYRDYRPVIQATQMASNGERRYGPGRWDEEAMWLLGTDALSAALRQNERQPTFAAEQSGYFAVRSESGFAFARCGGFKHRPSHADSLHVDVWWRGQNIALDAGTYSYNAPPPWDNSLSKTNVHNTLSVDDCDQMEKASRFLWLPWLHGRSAPATTSQKGHLVHWQGQHDGYFRLESPVNHCRALVRIGDQHWLVIDRLMGASEHTCRLNWLLIDAEYQFDQKQKLVSLETPEGLYHVGCGAVCDDAICSLVRADEESTRGWYSRRYYEKQPALSLALEATESEIVFWTLLGPGPCVTKFGDGKFVAENVAAKWRFQCEFANDNQPNILDNLTIAGSIDDSLLIAK